MFLTPSPSITNALDGCSENIFSNVNRIQNVFGFINFCFKDCFSICLQETGAKKGCLRKYLIVSEGIMEKVLVVDDEQDICILISKFLQTHGASTDYALNISEALVKATTECYELFIIDLNLAGGSGYDLIAKLKEMKITSKIILISAHDSEARNALEKGADYFIAKPLSRNSLNEALQNINFKN